MEVTARDLCRNALKKAGVFGRGQTPLAEDLNDAFQDLKGMLGQWQRKRWNIPNLVDLYITSTGAGFYTIGPGGDIDFPTRPDKVASAFCRLGGNGGASSDFGPDFNSDFGPQPGPPSAAVDFPLGLITSREDYNLIGVKGFGSFPDSVFYEPTYPLGTLYVYPVPSAGIYEIHVAVSLPIAQSLALSNDINLPDEYYEALLYNLAVRLRPSYQLEPDPSLAALATAALNTIKVANAQVPTMNMPDTLSGNTSRYNIFSDR